MELFYLLPILTIFFLLSAAFFTGTEMAIISSDRLELKNQAEKGNHAAKRALYLKENIENLVSTTQLGTNFSIAVATTLSTIFTLKFFGQKWEVIVIPIFTLVVLIFCDSIPKVIARKMADKLSIKLAPPMTIVFTFATPICYLITLYTRKISAWMGIKAMDTISRRKKARDELNSILNEGGTDSIEIKVTERRMIRKILQFSNQKVKRAMIPLVQVEAVEKNKTVQEVSEMFETNRHSRMPVFDERIDNIIGVVHFWDLFFAKSENDPIANYMKSAVFVPEFQQIDALITDLTNKEAKMAIVVDEYGGAVGMITKEDILEEVVGDIEDEFDEDSLTLHEISENNYIANVNIEIDDLNERLSVNLPKDDYETLSGFLLQQFNRIPEVGDELYFSNIKFRVYRATEKSIKSVIITILSTEQ